MASTDPQQQQQQQQQKQFLQIAQHDKFYSKVLSKETSLANPSFRVYYGRASVPFVWESQPGTPKRYSMDPTAPGPLPPITPPPSYHRSNPKRKKPNSKSNLIHRLKRNSNTTTSSTNTCTASLSSSSSSSGSHGRRYTNHSLSSSSSKAEADDSADEGSSPKSTLRAGCYSMLLVKNILLSIVGGGGQGPSDRDASS